MYNIYISIIKRVNMAKTVKKTAKKAVKKVTKVTKVNPAFERAVRTATWCSVGFCLFDLLWSVLAYGFDVVYALVMVVLAILCVALKFAHDKNNLRIQDGFSGVVMAILLVISVGSFAYEMPLIAPIFGKELVPTVALVLDAALLAVLFVFTIVHFMCSGKNAKKAIFVNRKLNFVILLLSVALMVVFASIFGTDSGMMLVEAICFYGVIIFVTDIVQRLEEGK